MQISTILVVILTNCLLPTLSASTQQPHELKLLVPLHKYSIESSLGCEDHVVASTNGTSRVDMLFVMGRIANETIKNNRSLIQYKSMMRKLIQGRIDWETQFKKIIIHLPTTNQTFKQVTDEIDLYIRYFEPYFGGLFLDTDDDEEFDSDVMDYLKFQVTDSKVLNSSDLFVSNRIFTSGNNTSENGLWSPRLVYEFTCATWLASSSSPNKSRASFAVVIRDCESTSEMKRAVDKAFEYQVGYVFVTNDSEWRSLPVGYFDEQIDYIAERNNQDFEISFTNWIISAFVVFVCLVLIVLLVLMLVFIFIELRKLVNNRKQRVKAKRRPIYNEYSLPEIIVSNEEENNEVNEKLEENEILKEEKKKLESNSINDKKKKKKKIRYSLQPVGSIRNGVGKSSSLQSIPEYQ